MGLWDKVKGQLIDVIEWVDASQDTLVSKFPRGDNEIKNGAQLIVRESQSAVFLHEGQLGDIFGPGRVALTTRNIPVLTSLASWKYGFNSPFKCDIYFVNTKQFTDQKWGTANPIMLRDPEFGPIRLRAFGTYCFRVEDPGQFIRQIAGTNPDFDTDGINDQLRNILASRFPDALGESKIAALDLAANYNELGDLLTEQMQPEFTEYGLQLTKFLIENISMPPEVEEALDQRAKMGVLGNLQAYTQLKTADAIGDMAQNPNAGGGPMGMIAGLGMGGVVTGGMQAAMQNQNQPAQPQQQQQPGPPPMPQQAVFYAAINGQQAGPFDMNALRTQVGQGAITAETLVWKQGMANWTPAGQVGEVASLFAAPPPIPGGAPPPPPPKQG